jgi:hypothetical protein
MRDSGSCNGGLKQEPTSRSLRGRPHGATWRHHVARAQLAQASARMGCDERDPLKEVRVCGGPGAGGPGPGIDSARPVGNAGWHDSRVWAMGVSDIAGVFSRYFVVGFFVPSFVVLMLVSQLLAKESLPPVYLDASAGARIAVIGGSSLLVGLVLLGLNYQVLRLFEGYPLMRRWFARPIRLPLVLWQRWRLKRAWRGTRGSKTEKEKLNARYRLARRFPPDLQCCDVLPTGFGNAVRAFERYSTIRWNLNAIAAWPRIEMLLSPEEQQLLADAKGNVAFFVNGSLLAGLGGCALIADRLLSQASELHSGTLYAIPFILSALCYLAATEAAIAWGEVVKASIDLHRLELYKKVGLRIPLNFTDERESVAPAFNRAVNRGEKIDDEYAATP